MRRKSENLILRDKGEFTKFQILFEVMRNQPHVKQKDISDAIGITIQAVSKYFKTLTRDGLLEVGSERADYRLTPKAVEKLREDIKYLERYVNRIKREMKVEHHFPAMATKQIKTGEKVGLMVKKGILYAVASSNPESEAFGIATTDASRGEDVGLKELEGTFKFRQGKILMVKLPSIKQGGSRAVDVEKIRALYEEFHPDRIGVMGAVARATLNKLGLKPDIEFGISRAAALAAARGLNVFLLVVGRMVNSVIEEIDTTNMKSVTNIIYEVKDGRKT